MKYEIDFNKLHNDIITGIKFVNNKEVILVDESAENHFTQIIFLLKESFSSRENGFDVWK